MLRARLGGSGVLWPLLPAAGDRAHDDPGPEPEDDQVDDHLPGDHQPGRFSLGGDIAEADGGELRGMLAAVTGSAPAWRTALGELPIVRGGRWAVGGSACLALHGLPVDPRDLDLLADHVAAAELVDGLRGAVVSDEARWDRGDARAVRRALAVVHGVEVEILEGVEAVGPAGEVVVATPDLDQLDQIIVSGRRIPVLPLPAMQVLLDATGNRERAAMIAKVLGGGR